MQRFRRIFGDAKCITIGMIHVDALPGTPKYNGDWGKIIEKSKRETEIYTKHNMDAILVENMHDVPYVQDSRIGPEVISSMTRIAAEIRSIFPKSKPLGIQILACANRQALAIAKAAELQFIRAEGFVFGHIADEGYTNACAGDLLRYRRQIDADDILVFTDIKKKHSSHSITADVNLPDTAHAAEFFLSDGIILTGTSTGQAPILDDLTALYSKTNLPILLGSGITKSNIDQFYPLSDAIIVGSHFKETGFWANELCESRIAEFMKKIYYLRSESNSGQHCI